MARLCRRIAASVFAGVLMTIALAWMCAVARPFPRASPGLLHIDRRGDYWMGFGEQGPGWRAATLYGAPGLTDAGRAASAPVPSWMDTASAEPIESRAITTVGAGWPMIALRARRTGIGHDEPPPGSTVWHTGLGPQWVQWGDWQGALDVVSDQTSTAHIGRPLPLTIRPMGFVIDAALWSAVLSLPLVLTALRLGVRRRRDQCERCGYDLRGDVTRVCPECGTSLTNDPPATIKQAAPAADRLAPPARRR